MTDLEFEAIALAIDLHRDQKYGDGVPYIKHLSCAVRNLRNFGMTSETVLAAGWLHDAIEDCIDPCAARMAIEFLSPAVLKIVEAVTNKPGKNRKERHEKTYPGIRESYPATLVKVADRFANVEYSLDTASGKLGMYVKEYPAFRVALYQPNLPQDILEIAWGQLDDLMEVAEEGM